MKLVEAVKTRDEIARIERLLKKHGSQSGTDLYADIWRFGVNVGLRISDLLNIRYDDIDTVRHEMILVERKTSKSRKVKLNPTALSVFQRRQTTHPHNVYMFTSKSADRPVSRVAVARKFKEVGHIVNVKLGTHSMRKTRGWIMHNDGVSIEKICMVLNHSSPAVTMRYLGLTQADVDQTYLDYEL